VWVARFGVRDPFATRASNVGYRRNLYTLTASPHVGGDPDPLFVDRALSGPEPRLPAAIRELIESDSRPLSAHTWAMTLVPFIAGLFVRTPEFALRFEARLKDLFGPAWRKVMAAAAPDNTNLVRLFELQRLYAPITRQEWTVVHFDRERPLVTNDCGYAPHQNSATGQLGYVIPLRPDAALVVKRGPHQLALAWSGDEWLVRGVEHATMSAGDAHGLNEVIAGNAIAEVYGPTRASTAAVQPHLATGPSVAIGPMFLAASSAELRASEMDWFKLLTLISAPPAEAA